MTKSNTWFKILFIVMAVLYILAGIVAIMNPFSTQFVMTMFIGTMCLIYGAMIIVSYFMSTHYNTVWALILGIVMVVLGIVIDTNLFNAANVLGVIAGIGFLIIGAYKTFQSFQLKDFGYTAWWAVLISGICGVLIGCLMVFNPTVSGQLLAIYVGAGFLATGISDLILGISLL